MGNPQPKLNKHTTEIGVGMKKLDNLKLSKYLLDTTGNIYSIRVNQLLTGWVNSSGYRTYGLTDDNGIVVQIPTHILVASTFIVNSNPLKFTQVNHIDGNKLNNNVTNLEWVSPSENTQHVHDNWLNKGKNFSERSIEARDLAIKDPYETSDTKHTYSEEDIINICEMIECGYRDVDISRLTGFNRRYINQIRHNESDFWKEVISQYKFEFDKEQRISIEKVIQICNRLVEGCGVLQISRELNVERKTVGNIKNRKTFKNISKSFIW